MFLFFIHCLQNSVFSFLFNVCRILRSSPSLAKAPLHVFTGQNQ